MKLLLTGLAISLAAGVPIAGADDATPHRYAGGCGFTTINDTTPNHALGGNETWNGEASVLVRTTDATGTPTVEPVAAACELFVDGVSQGVVVSGSGYGVAAGVASVAYRADPGDTVTICAHVTVGTRHTHCDDVAAVPVIPPPVVAFLDAVINVLIENVIWQLEPCYTAPYAGYYGPVFIDGDGDVYLFGTDEEHLWWDCPPYYVPPGG